MFPDYLQFFCKKNYLSIIDFLNQKEGSSIRDISNHFEMSYMGVKQICEKLEKANYIKSYTDLKKKRGRPEKFYYLTEKVNPLFSYQKEDFILHFLQSSENIYGIEAKERIIWNLYKTLKEKWESKIKNFTKLSEKINQLVILKNQSGYRTTWKYHQESKEFRITDSYHPLQKIFEETSFIKRLEKQIFEEILETKIEIEISKQGITCKILSL